MSAEQEAVDVRVIRRTMLARDIAGFELAALDGGDLPHWTPGAHIEVTLPGTGPRHYSLCGAPDDVGTWRIAVLREADGRGGSEHLHARVREGDTLTVSVPRNSFELGAADRYLLIAGGIGITPLRAMIRQLDVDGAEWELHYAARSADQAAFRDELSPYGERVHLHLADEGTRLDVDAVLAEPRAGTVAVYACGPARLLDAIQEANRVHGLALATERFVPREIEGANHPFTATLAASGLEVEVDADESLLDAIERSGAWVMSSCRSGICGTCEVVVLAGDAEHRDSVMTPEEHAESDLIYPCVSRALGDRLELDL